MRVGRRASIRFCTWREIPARAGGFRRYDWGILGMVSYSAVSCLVASDLCPMGAARTSTVDWEK